jgi:hypothetical protein
MDVTTHDGEDGITLTAILDRVIDNVVLLCGLLLTCILHVLDALVGVAEVDLSETFIEEDLGGVELEFETQLFVVTGCGLA